MQNDNKENALNENKSQDELIKYIKLSIDCHSFGTIISKKEDKYEVQLSYKMQHNNFIATNEVIECKAYTDKHFVYPYEINDFVLIEEQRISQENFLDNGVEPFDVDKETHTTYIIARNITKLNPDNKDVTLNLHGNYVKIDGETHDIKIFSRSNIDLQGEKNINITAKENISIKNDSSSTNITIDKTGNIEIKNAIGNITILPTGIIKLGLAELTLGQLLTMALQQLLDNNIVNVDIKTGKGKADFTTGLTNWTQQVNNLLQ